MKKRIIRILSIVLCLAAAAAIAACGVNRGTPVMTLGGKSVTDHMYEYWADSYKAMILRAYSGAADTDEFWNMRLSDGERAEDFFNGLTYDYIESNLVAMYLFDELGLEPDEGDRETAESIVDELEETLAGGNRNEFNRQLADYGVNRDLLVEIFLEEQKTTYVYNHVFESGKLSVTDKEKNEYLNDSYVRIRQIYINNKYDYDASHYDESGNFIMVPLDDETKAEKDAKIKEASLALASGADFDSLYEEYSEEKEYPNGYYLSATTEGLPPELIRHASALSEGESATFESDYGTHIIKRLEMDDGAYKDEANSDFFPNFTEEVYEWVFSSYVESYYDKIESDGDAISKYTIRTLPANYYYRY